KHCALQVYPEHYPIVGENLIKAIQDVTGLEDNDPIIQTWVKAYGELADAFIQIEKSIYDQMLWIGFKPFKVSKIKQESQDVKSFTIESSERSEEHTSELQSRFDLVCRLHLEKKETT